MVRSQFSRSLFFCDSENWNTEISVNFSGTKVSLGNCPCMPFSGTCGPLHRVRFDIWSHCTDEICYYNMFFVILRVCEHNIILNYTCSVFVCDSHFPHASVSDADRWGDTICKVPPPSLSLSLSLCCVHAGFWLSRGKLKFLSSKLQAGIWYLHAAERVVFALESTWTRCE